MKGVLPFYRHTQREGEEMTDDESSSTLHESDLKEQLLQAFEGVSSSGSFAIQHSTTHFVNPGLDVNGCGLIPLPLCPRDAQAIIQASQQAPFGKGDETLVDLSVRKTWELDVTQFKLTNPAWDAFLMGTFGSKIVEGLGVASSIKLSPYKLLLYEEGAFFKPHKDTEKVPGIFGTLVVCLPSKHEGGQVHLSHAGSRKIFATASASQFDLSALAWYSDVTHEIKPVESGYRLVLTYNLARKNRIGAPISATSVLRSENLLEVLLRRWRTVLPYRNKLVHILDYQYSQASLHLQGLKRHDRALCQTLQNVASANGCYLFLGALEHTRTGNIGDYADWYKGDEIGETIVEDIVTLSGIPVTSDMSHILIQSADILDHEAFERDPDSEDKGDYTGNKSKPPLFRYYDSVVIIVPQDRLCEIFLTTTQMPSCEIIDIVCEDSEKDQQNTLLRQTAIRILEETLQRTAQGFYSQPERAKEFQDMVVKWSITFNYTPLCREALAARLAHGSLPSALLEMIAERIKHDYLATSNVLIRKQRLDAILPNKPSLSGMLNFLKSLKCKMTTPELILAFDLRMEEKVEEYLKENTCVTAEDAPALVEQLQSRGIDWFLSKCMPHLLNCNSPEFHIALLTRAYKHLATTSSQAALIKFFQTILRHKAELLACDLIDSRETDIWTRYTPLGAPKAADFVTLMDFALTMGGLEGEIGNICKLSAENCIKNKGNPWLGSDSSLHFIRVFTATLAKHKISIFPPGTQKLVEVLLEAFVQGLAKKKPHPLPGWAMEGGNCTFASCEECPHRLRFLKSAVQQVGYFTMNESKRKHIELYLHSRYFDIKLDRTTRPFTLVVKKTRREQADLLIQWYMNIEKLEREFRTLRSPFMESLLGKRYGELVLLQHLRGNGSTVPSTIETSHGVMSTNTPQGPLNGGPVAPVAGVKRKKEPEVIDLLDSD